MIEERQRERDAANGKSDQQVSGAGKGFADLVGTCDHVGFGLVDQLVGQTLQALGQRAGAPDLRLAALGDLARADRLDHLRDDGNESLVVLAHPAEDLDLVLRHELQAIEVIAELIELAQRCLQRSLVGHEQRRRDAVQLRGRVVLDLPVGGDLALELHQVLGALIDRAEFGESHATNGDQQRCNGQKRGQQLRVDRKWRAHDGVREPVERLQLHSRSSERRSRSISSESKR